MSGARLSVYVGVDVFALPSHAAGPPDRCGELDVQRQRRARTELSAEREPDALRLAAADASIGFRLMGREGSPLRCTLIRLRAQQSMEREEVEQRHLLFVKQRITQPPGPRAITAPKKLLMWGSSVE